MPSQIVRKPLTLGHMRKLMEIWPDDWDDLELRVCFGGLSMGTSEVIHWDQVKVRKDTDAVDHDAKREESRFCFVFTAEKPK